MNGVLAVGVLVALAASPLLIDVALRSLRRRMRRRSWIGVPAVDLAEPIAAVKRARVRVSPDGRAATLSGLTFGGRYEAEDDARCPYGCIVPQDGCDCGFYAVLPQTEAEVLGAIERRPGSIASVRLEVELSGAVLEYQLGYRAEHQRVLSVSIPKRCAPCARRGLHRAAAALTPAPRAMWEPHGPVLPNPSGGNAGGDGATGFFADGWPVLEPVCPQHHPVDEAVPTLGPADLAGLLGTEVAWGPADRAGLTSSH